jgi:hypothetical protein
MSIDSYFLQQSNGSFRRINPRREDTDIWVDVAHGKNVLVDERYYFTDLAQALAFYESDCKTRQFLDDDGRTIGIDHSGLYAKGKLILGVPIV